MANKCGASDPRLPCTATDLRAAGDEIRKQLSWSHFVNFQVLPKFGFVYTCLIFCFLRFCKCDQSWSISPNRSVMDTTTAFHNLLKCQGQRDCVLQLGFHRQGSGRRQQWQRMWSLQSEGFRLHVHLPRRWRLSLSQNQFEILTETCKAGIAFYWNQFPCLAWSKESPSTTKLPMDIPANRAAKKTNGNNGTK